MEPALQTLDSEQESRLILERLSSMGIDAKRMQGGRCVLARLRVQSTAFAGLDEPLRIDQIVFATIGRDRIKCLRPRALFQLPMIRIADCRDVTSIEARIHLAWKKHVTELLETRHWLRRIGTEVNSSEQGSVLTFQADDASGPIRMIDRKRVILPSHGALAGFPMQRVEDRVPWIDRSIVSSVDLQMALTTRMQELAQINQRLEDERRRRALANSKPTQATPVVSKNTTPILMVGPKLARERQCIESLRLRGYQVHTAHNEHDGIALYDKISPQLVLADAHLGRSEGTDFVLSLRRVYGVEEIPVIIVDAARHEGRREAAKRVGAAGYLVHPVEVQRIENRIQTMVAEPKRRRFTRYSRTLPIAINGAPSPCMVTALGRGGLFLATDDDFPESARHECRLTLPELGRAIEFESEVIYHRAAAGRERAGVGVRFNAFEQNDEPVLIQYLRTIESSPGL